MRHYLLLAILLIHSLFSNLAVSDEIVLVADVWCPYNCEPNSDTPGYLIEIAQYAFEKEGHTIKYLTLPWSRAIQMVRNGEYHGIVGTGKSETPEFIFPKEPLIRSEHVFYTNLENKWTYDGLESLKKINLGVINDYSYGALYEEYIRENAKNSKQITTVFGDDGLNRLIKMLEKRRIDAFIEEKQTILEYLKRSNREVTFKSAGVGSEEQIFIAFSPNNAGSKKYAKILSKGYKELRSSGKLEILKRIYGL